MRKFSKKYVLIDEDLYERKFKSDSSVEKAKRYNPFTNPNITEAKNTREELQSVAGNSSLDVHNASLLLQQLVQQYADNFSKATTKQRKVPKPPRNGKATNVERMEEAAGTVDRTPPAARPLSQAFCQPTQQPPHSFPHLALYRFGAA